MRWEIRETAEIFASMIPPYSLSAKSTEISSQIFTIQIKYDPHQKNNDA